MSAGARYQVRSDPDFPLEFSRVVDTFATLDGHPSTVDGSTRRHAHQAYELASRMNAQWEATYADATEGRAR
jgi:hypothetical protein